MNQKKIYYPKKTNNNDIIKYLLTDKDILGIKYSLIGTINTPQIDHYNALILNLKTNYKSLELNKNYAHDGLKNNHRICEVNNICKFLEMNNPLIGIYIKKN